MIFPILSGGATLAVSIPLITLMVMAFMAGEKNKEVFGTVHYIAMGITYFVNYFVVIFFNSALVACAHDALQGRPTTPQDGIRAAARKLPQILLWSLIASTVGMILRKISEETGVIGSIISGLIGLVWNVAVFFVVPVLVIDNEKPIEAIKTSAGMIKQTWGERLILGVGLSLAIGAASLVLLIPFFGAIALAIAEMYVFAIVLVVFCVLMGIGIAIVGSAMTTIHQTALYVYCRSGESPAAFSPGLLQGAFAEKPAKKVFGRK